MSIVNFAKNKFFEDDDYAYNSVARARNVFDNVNPEHFPLNIDLIQAGDMYVVIADIPGVPKDRVSVQVKDNKIMIEGKRKKKVVSDEDVYLIAGRRNGFFKKMIEMPIDADSQQMVAKIEDGMLILTIPRVKTVNGATYVSIH
ncbi:uncharacterized protein [Blastocystis hominis]|uniref:SHSP domain-containing protein n=1 Tax=Blastocystis hominis TaxID=12968 RepID=D8M3W2_BLAHO|nr:uncharacterized protein [Blastocystis hominis]CBK22585.2 unnamed protein product [Blastocystis hominis]|eukprot:XP_012896633.1 uncharacterized protein [Blastocystis hominis]